MVAGRWPRWGETNGAPMSWLQAPRMTRGMHPVEGELMVAEQMVVAR